jgi:hypothetical protein
MFAEQNDRNNCGCGPGSSSRSSDPPRLCPDVLFHRSLKPAKDPEVLVYGFPHGEPAALAEHGESNLLPMPAELLELAGSPPAVATPLVPRYTQLVSSIYSRMGWEPSEFVGMRVQMQFPPMQSRVLARWGLL